jgi:hypothetical protein
MGPLFFIMRYEWVNLSDEMLLRQCEVDTYRASGPGGQKRNKTSSAVRIRHLASQLLVIAEESRSQHENKAKALRRLRKAFYLKLREPLEVGVEDGWLASHREISPALDMLELCQARVSDVAKALGASTASVVGFMKQDDKVWETLNQIRQKYGQHLMY